MSEALKPHRVAERAQAAELVGGDQTGPSITSS